uniref:Beta-defensin-like domain-containing protein n=1 Tax=Nothoprocta perdicaria TaxID=30464 RepID=A0A8C6ZA54_NOTPE
MKISYLFFAVICQAKPLLLHAGFMRAPNSEMQCKNAGGFCFTDQCPPHMRLLGRCQQKRPCCVTMVS